MTIEDLQEFYQDIHLFSRYYKVKYELESRAKLIAAEFAKRMNIHYDYLEVDISRGWTGKVDVVYKHYQAYYYGDGENETVGETSIPNEAIIDNDINHWVDKMIKQKAKEDIEIEKFEVMSEIDQINKQIDSLNHDREEKCQKLEKKIKELETKKGVVDDELKTAIHKLKTQLGLQRCTDILN